MSILLSILIPVRNEEENVNIISKEIITKISIQSYEILFINDFSEDNTETELIKLNTQNTKTVYYNNTKKGLGEPLILAYKNQEEIMYAL